MHEIPTTYKGMFDLTGKTAIVTGSARGMGYEMARGLMEHGAKVLLVDLNKDGVEEARASLESQGGIIGTISLDVTADDAPARIIEAARELGGVDILVNNAGILSTADFPDMGDDQWDRVMGINLRAPMRIMREALKAMIDQGSGSIINMGSSWSSRASAFNQDGGGPDYCASKAALQALTRSAAQDGATSGVRVNAIAPGVVDTKMHEDRRALIYEYEKYIPVGRMQLAHDVVGACVFLAAAASSYITGQTVHVNGGLLMID
ncbi:SDR family NAD(P)-dependent oxidoreductase [Ruicaihuangia caeni]|uniref:SDR family NAD(P)-dependent oxidoreductase n=1 Tax=Ruicaihuangia caeni TaxID=3042517 RepID=A0AAW6T6D6_9MICO|nr:SDR family NAD(P)-dependent oxidoreductase [Klugiella sp. YN-L-19]MDI2097383.1 SDR family NAD(P)-dependent oxidoreductase [Klugiella sp. YN-L-19]